MAIVQLLANGRYVRFNDATEEVERLLSVTNGPINTEPLKPFGYRFEPKKGTWQRLQKFKGTPSSVAKLLRIIDFGKLLWEVAADAKWEETNVV